MKLRAVQGILLAQGIADAFTGASGAPLLNPFGAQSPEFLRYLEDDVQFRGTLQTATGELSMAGAEVNGTFLELPSGKVSAALGLEYGQDKVAFNNSDAVAQHRVLGFFAPGGDVAATRNRYSITAELLIPVLERLELDASLRRDHYNDFGNTVNPKLFATLNVIDRVLSMHASYNTGFRAPTLYELFAPRDFGFTVTSHDDPLLCPGGTADASKGGIQLRDCGGGFATLKVANPHLEAVESQAVSLGFDWSPLRGLALGVDFWDYTVDKTVGALSDISIFGNPSRFASYIVRCSQSEPQLRDPTFVGCKPDGTPESGGGDPIAYVLQNVSNIGRTETDGLDFGMTWVRDFDIGALRLDYRGTYIGKYRFQEIPGDPFISRVGVYVNGSPIIRYSHYASLSWQKASWGVELQNRLLGGYVDFNNGDPRNTGYEFYHEVRPYSLWDLSASYRHGDKWTVMALVKNVLDTDPPFTNKDYGLGTGYDERLTDPTGRAFGLTITAQFSGLGDLFQRP